MELADFAQHIVHWLPPLHVAAAASRAFHAALAPGVAALLQQLEALRQRLPPAVSVYGRQGLLHLELRDARPAELAAAICPGEGGAARRFEESGALARPLYLPKFVDGQLVLTPTGSPDEFLVENESLQARFPGVHHRRSKSAKDRHPDRARFAPWGSTVSGVLLDEWLELKPVTLTLVERTRWLHDVDWAAVGGPCGDELKALLFELGMGLPSLVLRHEHVQGTGWYGASEITDTHIFLPLQAHTLEFSYRIEYHD